LSRCPLTSRSQSGIRTDSLVATSPPWALRWGPGSSPPMSTNSTQARSARRCTPITPLRSYCSSSLARRHCAIRTERRSCRPAPWLRSPGVDEVRIAWSTGPTHPFATSWSPRPIAPTSSSTRRGCDARRPRRPAPCLSGRRGGRFKSPSLPKRCGQRPTDTPDAATPEWSPPAQLAWRAFSPPRRATCLARKAGLVRAELTFSWLLLSRCR
jgi:hypothetical protein